MEDIFGFLVMSVALVLGIAIAVLMITWVINGTIMAMEWMLK